MTGDGKNTWTISSERQAIGPITSYGLALWGIQGLLYPDDTLFRGGRGQPVLAGYLPALQPFIRNNGHLKRTKLWAFAGGKGGVGKSFLCAALGALLARHGKRTVIVDADFSGPNMHTLFQVPVPRAAVWKRLRMGENLATLLTPTAIPHLKLVCAPPHSGEKSTQIMNKIRFIDAVRNLPADYVLIDLGPRMDSSNLDYFLTADNQILVTTPEPMALQNLGAFIRSLFKRKIDTLLFTLSQSDAFLDIQDRQDTVLKKSQSILRQNGLPAEELIRRAVASLNLSLVYNMVRDEDRVKPSKLLQRSIRRETGVDIDHIADIRYQPGIRQLLQHDDIKKLLSIEPLLQDLYQAAQYMIKSPHVRDVDIRRFFQPTTKKPRPGLICGSWCLNWNDCGFQTPGTVCPVKNIK